MVKYASSRIPAPIGISRYTRGGRGVIRRATWSALWRDALEPRVASMNSCQMTGIRTRNDAVAIGVLLAAVGGFLDAYTFVQHGVFANAQTGNVVLFSVEAASRHWHEAVLRLLPIAAFMVGVVATETLARPRVRRQVRRPLRVALGAEIVILAGVACLPDDAPAAFVTIPVAF